MPVCVNIEMRHVCQMKRTPVCRCAPCACAPVRLCVCACVPLRVWFVCELLYSLVLLYHSSIPALGSRPESVRNTLGSEGRGK